jgi:hypothetical protein
MPFDRNDGALTRLPLIHAYHWAPGAPCTGRTPAMALEGAYLYSRAYARTIGVQTYRTTQLTSLANNFAVNQTALVPIARWRVTLPDTATTVLAHFVFSLVGGTEGLVSHRLDVTDGVDTDTGDVIVQEFRNDTPGEINVGGFTSYDYAHANHAEAQVVRVDTAGAGDFVVTAHAFAVTSDGNARGYRPHSVLAWYEVLEV